MANRITNALRQSALTIGAGLGVLCLLMAVAGPLLDIRLLVFESGSMTPTIDTGGVALTHTVDAHDVDVGDIVSVTTSAGDRVTHRVVETDRGSGRTVLTLRGDANPAPDLETYPVDRVDRVFLHANRLGFVVRAVASPYSVFVAGALVGGLLLMTFRRRVVVPAAGLMVVALAAGTLLPPRLGPTLASFSDPGSVKSGALSSMTMAAPVVSCGTLTVGTTTLHWTAVPRATGYVLHYGAGGSTTEAVGPNVTSKSFSGLVASGDFSVEATVASGATTWTSARSNAKHYTVLLILVGVCT